MASLLQILEFHAALVNIILSFSSENTIRFKEVNFLIALKSQFSIKYIPWQNGVVVYFTVAVAVVVTTGEI